LKTNIHDSRDFTSQITEAVWKFSKALESGDRLKIYSCFDTNFQRQVPLNYFLLHPRYQLRLGNIIKVLTVLISEDKRTAVASVELEIENLRQNVDLYLKTDYGGWKLEGDLLFDN
jgi:hypothetical protein